MAPNGYIELGLHLNMPASFDKEGEHANYLDFKVSRSNPDGTMTTFTTFNYGWFEVVKRENNPANN